MQCLVRLFFIQVFIRLAVLEIQLKFSLSCGFTGGVRGMSHAATAPTAANMTSAAPVRMRPLGESMRILPIIDPHIMAIYVPALTYALPRNNSL